MSAKGYKRRKGCCSYCGKEFIYYSVDPAHIRRYCTPHIKFAWRGVNP